MTDKMSVAHEIEYSIFVYLAAAGNGTTVGENSNKTLDEKAPEIMGLEYQSETELEYAEYFKIYHYDQGIVLLGNLYTWDRITQADVTDTEETQEIKVEFTVKKVSRFVYFTTAQRDAVEEMLTRYEQERAELELKAKAKG